MPFTEILPVVCFSILFAGPLAGAETQPLRPWFEIEGSFEEAALAGNLLFLAVREAEMGQPNILIYRTRRHGPAQRVGSYMSRDNAAGMVPYGRYLLVADGQYGFEVVDVRDPARARRVAFQALPGFSHRLVLSGHLALVASGLEGMHIIDVRRPEKPRLVGTFQPFPRPLPADAEEPDDATADGLFDADDSAPTGDRAAPAVFSDDHGQISPRELERKEGALDIAVDGHFAYLAYGSAGIVTVDIADPAKPRLVHRMTVDSPAESLTLSHGTLHYTTGIWGLHMVDMSSPGAPKPLSELRTLCYPWDVAASADYAYVADGLCGRDGLLVVDLHHTRSPEVIATYPGKVSSVRVFGNRLFSMGMTKTRAFRISP